ncbi:TPA: tagatose-bisphosphate aldolase, partial [Streptococcus equi subsp. zooepidemicus]|nr:tagatose-bisphosphate aldolase [Streptococcus equi subsp. zooepidemicus]HEL0588186.1 tagatose-bisphosphate aldolase [Streptococcus equi subsp. zooepidemicus]HEL0733229.1 tagatose-bisphosphate aldolase [Streptococcus equi subsp. zooepidemicus]HEL1038353.1 tagatose-bisphosphate aldolase [Streptococcus equi subsp. zooepidemicus]HEL1050012.1 tagatose-bisphosphate aldolase [Streptococcus equi subsp. zooepidemicus]
MYHLSKAKYRLLEKVSRKGIISALAFDQRGALKRMMAAHQDTEPAPWQIEA